LFAAVAGEDHGLVYLRNVVRMAHEILTEIPNTPEDQEDVAKAFSASHRALCILEVAVAEMPEEPTP